MEKRKFYVVWVGRVPGIYCNWDDCREQVEGFPGAKFKGFNSQTEATEAFRGDPSDHLGVLRAIASHKQQNIDYSQFPEIDTKAIAVDAACSRNPGPVEYRGVDVGTGAELFHVGPLEGGSNNLGEFLALVHALAHFDKVGLPNVRIYTDSRTALAWVRNRKVKSTITPDGTNSRILQLVARAEKWLATHTPRNPIEKWNTEKWGEIPADFGRK